MQANIVTIGVC